MQLLETDLSPENLAYKDEICRLSLLALDTCFYFLKIKM